MLLDLPEAPAASHTVTLHEQLRQLQHRLLDRLPVVDRIRCTLYNPHAGNLHTLLQSTRDAEAAAPYLFTARESQALTATAHAGEPMPIEALLGALEQLHEHRDWLASQGYRGGFATPLYGTEGLLGLAFFDSRQAVTFDATTQRDLVLFSGLINMALLNDISTVRALQVSAQVARDFADLRDVETGAHLERMSRYARLIAAELTDTCQRDGRFAEQVYLFAPLHDIGKIGIPDHILQKPGKLTPEEYTIIQTHVLKGCDIIDKIIADFRLQHHPDSRMMRNMVAYHHEMLDGSGYPFGLRGEDIPPEARIVTVADIFDALTSARAYKRGWTLQDALSELQRMAGAGKLDADCVAVLVQYQHDLDHILELE
jgi:HD-GYP domain-containing protein (c-di-GMP phosphodiesterase class II)